MPRTLNLRALRPDDAPAVTSILAEMERREPVDEAYDEPEVIEEMSSPAVDLARGSVDVLDGDTQLAFGALSISAPAATWKASLWGGVHPDHTHRGIGRRVIDHLVDRAREIRDADNPGAPGELKIWAESNRPGTAVVGAQAGFDTWRYFLRMRRDLGDPVAQLPAPDGLSIRPYPDAEDEAVRLVSNESFADHWGSTPMDSARAGERNSRIRPRSNPTIRSSRWPDRTRQSPSRSLVSSSPRNSAETPSTAGIGPATSPGSVPAGRRAVVVWPAPCWPGP